MRFIGKILEMISHNRKLKFLLPLLSAILLMFPGGFIQAASLGSRVGGFFISLIGLILYLFALVANQLMRLGGGLLSRVITLTFNENLFIEAPFVKVAWGFMRDIANIFFIAWLVIIAIATIIDYKGYQAKRLLPKLIIVAILINFSLVLCGVALDLGQGLMGFLTQSAITIEGQPYGLAEGLVLAFNQSELFGATLPGFGSFFGGINAAVNMVMQNALVLIFAGIAAYVFILLSVMMLVRVGALWLLLIFAPAVWVWGIMPWGQKIFRQWMSNFWKWVFYGVVVAFLLYLAAMAVWAIENSEWQKANFGDAANMGGERFGTNISFLENFSSLLSFMVVMILLMMAKNAGMSAAKSAGDAVTGAVGGYIMGSLKGKTKIGGFATRRLKEKAVDTKDNIKGRVGGVMMDKISTVPILGSAIPRQGAKMKAEADSARQKRRDKYAYLGNLSEDEQVDMARGLKGEALEKLMQQMLKNGAIHKLDRNNPLHMEALRKMNTTARKSGNVELLKDFEEKRIDMITDYSSHGLSLQEKAQVKASRDPVMEKQRILRDKEAASEARKQEVMAKTVKSGLLKNEDFVKNLSAEDLKYFALDKDSSKALTNAIGDFSEEVKQHVLDQLQAGFTDGFIEQNPDGTDHVDKAENIRNKKLRSTYAKVSGNYHEAYNADTSSLTGTQLDNKNEALKLAVSKISGEKAWQGIEDDDDGHNMELLASYMQKSQISNAGRSLDANTKKKIFDLIEAKQADPERKAAHIAMLKNDTWPGSYEEIESAEKEAEKMKKLEVEAHREDKRQTKMKTEEKAKQAKEMQKAEHEAYREKAKREKKKDGNDEGSSGGNPNTSGGGPAQPSGNSGSSSGANETPNSGGDGNNKDDNTIDLVQGNDGRWYKPGEEPKKEAKQGSPAGGGGTTNIQGGTINTESANINAVEVNIQTPEAINNSKSEGPVVPETKPLIPTIETPEPRGNVKFSSGPGWTPQQKKEVAEHREAKYREELNQRVTKKDIREKSDKELLDEGKERDIRLSNIAVNQTQGGEIEEAISSANKIKAYTKQGATLGEVASTLMDKGDFDGAFRAARAIKDDGMKETVIRDVMNRQGGNKPTAQPAKPVRSSQEPFTPSETKTVKSPKEGNGIDPDQARLEALQAKHKKQLEDGKTVSAGFTEIDMEFSPTKEKREQAAKLKNAAITQAKAGNIEEARRIKNQVRDLYSGAVGNLTEDINNIEHRNQFKGDLLGVADLPKAKEIKNKQEKTRVLANMAERQIAAGSLNDADLIIDSIPDKTAKDRLIKQVQSIRNTGTAKTAKNESQTEAKIDIPGGELKKTWGNTSKAIAQKIRRVVEDEDKLRIRSSDKGKTTSLKYGPVISALKSVLGSEEMVANRLIELLETAKDHEQRRLNSTEDTVLAHNKSLIDVFGDLAPNEQNAIREAVKTETQRQQGETKDRNKGGLAGSFVMPAETMLSELLTRINKE